MLLIVSAWDNQWADLTASNKGSHWQRVDDAADFTAYKHADAFFSLKNDTILPEFKSLQKPVIVHSVINTLSELNAPSNVYRINGWAGFLSRSVWEIAGNNNEEIHAIFKSSNIKINFVKDNPGFVASRIIAMIINEAYFAVEDQVSSKMEIDTAMKLGTNYPYGPFEWATLIGSENILMLLKKLYETDERYEPSNLLIKENSTKDL